MLYYRVAGQKGSRPGERNGDQPQLREEAVLAAGEQAGARGPAAFGRQRDREVGEVVLSKAVVAGGRQSLLGEPVSLV